MASRADEYRAGAVKCERRAKMMRNAADREWQQCLARAYRWLADVELERAAGFLAKPNRADRVAA